jgi:hypothetical protein
VNNKIRRQLILEHLQEARARLDLGGSVPRTRQAERHVRYWSDQLRQVGETGSVTGAPEPAAPAA